jgi:septal ring factor EnvC (AmiA/AmiB activator)
MAFVNKYTIGAVITILTIFFVWTYGKVQYNKGFSERDLKAQIEIKDLKLTLQEAKNKEVSRQIDINRKAQENSRKQLQQIQVEKDLLEKQIEDMEIEAKNDPNHSRIGLGVPSVMRLNKIR